MSNIKVEDIAKSSESITASINDEKIIDWVLVQESQQNLMKGFQATMEKLMGFRDNMQRNFITTLKDMKQLDASDLLKQVKNGKQQPSCLKSLLDYSIQEGEEIKLDIPALKDDCEKKQKQFIKMNEQSTEKLFEVAKWLDDFVKANIQISKDITSNIKSEESTLATGEVAKTQDTVCNFKFDEEKLNKIASNIQVQRIPDTNNLITIKTYSEIVEQSIQLAEEEFIRLTQENRVARRETQGDSKKYLQLMMDHLNDIENMLMKSQEDICKKLGITQEKLEQSEVTLMERGLGQQLFMMQASVRQRIKEKLPKKNNVGAKITREIIEYQIKVLNEKQDFFIPVLKEMPVSYETQQLIPVLLNLMISDLVYEEYNFEEEDYMHNLTDQSYFKEKEVMELLQGIESGIINLLQTGGLIPKNAGGMGGGFPGMMPPQGGMGGGMGGGFPGGFGF